MTKRQVFYSFHYEKDNWRVQQIRNIGVVGGTSSLSPNKWEELKRSGESNVKKWINDNLRYRSCTVVLIGEETANRKWVRYEIEQSWRMGKGLIGIYIHNLKDRYGATSSKGKNPFENVIVDGVNLGYVVPTYDPVSMLSTPYNEICDNIYYWVEDGINIRNKYNTLLQKSGSMECSNSIGMSDALVVASVGAVLFFGVWAFLKYVNGKKVYTCPRCNSPVNEGDAQCHHCKIWLQW